MFRPGSKVREVFSVDLRSLAAFRICAGLLLLADLIHGLPNYLAFYTNDGVLPAWAAVEYVNHPWVLSLHTAMKATPFAMLLLAAQALFAMALVLGYRTRLATIVTWFLLCSLHARNGVIVDIGDVTLRNLLFFGMFLPLGARWSVDAANNAPGEERAHDFSAVAVAAVFAQIIFFYYFAALHKVHPWWTQDATALYYGFSIEHFTSPLGEAALSAPALLALLTRATILLEVAGPLLILSPIATGRARMVAVVLFTSFHLGIAVFQQLGIVPFYSLLAWVLLIPALFWDRVPARARDAVRVLFVATAEKLAPLQRWIPARSAALHPPRWTAVLLGVVLVLTFLWNIDSVRRIDFTMPAPLKNASRASRVDQGFAMFAPTPLILSLWPVIPATLADGSTVDLATGGPVTWGKPERWPKRFDNGRWKFYFTEMLIADTLWPEAFLDFPEWMCRGWNDRHPPERDAITLNLYLLVRPSSLPDEEPFELERVLLIEHRCGGETVTHEPHIEGRRVASD